MNPLVKGLSLVNALMQYVQRLLNGHFWSKSSPYAVFRHLKVLIYTCFAKVLIIKFNKYIHMFIQFYYTIKTAVSLLIFNQIIWLWPMVILGTWKVLILATTRLWGLLRHLSPELGEGTVTLMFVAILGVSMGIQISKYLKSSVKGEVGMEPPLDSGQIRIWIWIHIRINVYIIQKFSYPDLDPLFQLKDLDLELTRAAYYK